MPSCTDLANAWLGTFLAKHWGNPSDADIAAEIQNTRITRDQESVWAASESRWDNMEALDVYLGLLEELRGKA